ncbi:MAG TPA: vitamin K epoxide reductase family protein [Actinomycetes bacterium]|jgi:uncharacterized membrane protein|nr:vitamin K epoxide reductase family protein [Actinomycetes bacterium]
MSRRIAAVALAALGLAVSGYLAAYQTHLLTTVWDPVFGPASSERVLHSVVSRALPVPDALLGGLAYAGEVVLGLVVLRTAAHLALLAYAALAGLMALTSVALVAIQLLVVHHLCLLCLVSAVVSWAVAALVLPEGLAALSRHRHEPARGLAGQERRHQPARRP